MQPETLYQFVNLSPLPAWALMVLAPRWRGTRTVVHAAFIPLALTLVYGLAMAVEPLAEGASGASLQSAMLLFSKPWSLLACWVHFIIGDLFAGTWVARDAQRLKLPHLAVVPCLLATLLMMPVGLAAYLVLRAVMRGRMTLEETAGAPVVHPESEGLRTA